MSTDGVYCKWCGTFVTGGGLFCNSCGREIDESTPVGTTVSHARAASYEDFDTEKPKGLFVNLADVAARIVGLVLALITTLISIALPLFVVLAFFMGPGDAWNMVRDWIPGTSNTIAACEGFSDWYKESAERPEIITRMLEENDAAASGDTATLISLARETDSLAAEQRNSNPPQEAIVLNGLMVKTIEFMGDVLRAVANGDEHLMQSLTLESERLTLELEAEEERVFEVCG